VESSDPLVERHLVEVVDNLGFPGSGAAVEDNDVKCVLGHDRFLNSGFSGQGEGFVKEATE
jgi:hypothetical protein